MIVYRGQHGAGKTARIEREIAEALKDPREGRRAAVITFPHTRWHWLGRFGRRHRAALGLAVTHWQRVYTEVLQRAGELGPAVSPAMRVALVARAHEEVEGGLPSPGMATLLTQAIAEAKRFEVDPRALVKHLDPEVQLLGRVWLAYEELKGNGQDPDDRRSLAVRLVQQGAVRLGYAYLAVDGFRELAPSEAAFLKAALPQGQAVAALPLEAPGFGGREVLLEGGASEPTLVRLGNPVEEAEWVLAQVKAKVQGGVDPAEVAIVVPRSLARVYREVAEALGVPLDDETRAALADTPGGSAVLSALSAFHHPSGENLRIWRQLEPLARRMALLGVSGEDAARRVAGTMAPGVLAALEALLERGRERERDPLGWVNWVVEALTAEGYELSPGVVEAGQAAAAIAERSPGTRVDHWWEGLLRGTLAPQERSQGVALVPPERLSGRRFAAVYVVGAAAGYYGAVESEDYFLPDLDPLRGKGPLPLRVRGRTRALFEELRRAGGEVVVSVPASGPEGRLEPHPLLVGRPLEAVPEPPRRVRVAVGDKGSLLLPKVPLPSSLAPREVGELQNLATCGFRFVFDRLVEAEPPAEVRWAELLSRVAEDPEDAEARSVLGLPEYDPEVQEAVWYEEPILIHGVEYRVRIPFVRWPEEEVVELWFFTDGSVEGGPFRSLSQQQRVRAYFAVPWYVKRVGKRVRLFLRGLEDGSLRRQEVVRLDHFWQRMLRSASSQVAPGIEAVQSGQAGFAANTRICKACRYRAVCHRP